MDAGSDQLEERMNELKQVVLHHVKKEEGQMFALARELGGEKLDELGERLQTMKSEGKGPQTGGRGGRKRAA